LFDARRGGITSKRRQWAAALAVSFAAHLLVLIALLAGIDRPLPPPVQPPIDVTLQRPIRPPERTKPPEPKVDKPAPPKPVPVKTAPPPPVPTQRPVPAPQAVAPAAPPPASSGPGRAPAAPPPAIVAGRGANGDDGAHADCIAKNMARMDPKERAACETHIFAFMDKHDQGETPPPGSAMDPEKRAAYDAAMARKHYKNAPVTSMGNAAQTGCRQANIGDGCPGDTTLPVYKKPF
jgi:hypothetical protein